MIPLRTSRWPIRHPPTTKPVSTAASGRYIRCSATVCVTTGTTLEVGAKIAKNHAPRKPTFGHRHNATTVAAPSNPSAIA